MAKFKKKPVVIDAVQLRTVEINDLLVTNGPLFDELPEWLLQAFKSEKVTAFKEAENNYAHLLIHTLEGQHLARPGDWIIRGIHGELYPCKPDIFSTTYEAVKEKNTNKPNFIYILAKDYEQARKYAYEKGYPSSRMVNVNKKDKLRGIHDTTLHVLPNAYLRKDYSELIQLAVTRRIAIKIVNST